MSKRPNQTDQINLNIINLTTHTEMKIFTSWFQDKPGFNQSHEFYGNRVNMARSNASTAFKGLVDKNILRISGYKPVPGKKSITIYDLHPNMLKKEAKNDVEQPLVTTDLTKTKIQEELDPEIEKLLAGYGA